jgi:hypothetical protein
MLGLNEDFATGSQRQAKSVVFFDLHHEPERN